ncbi:hypothetical protein [Alishewanella phage vB_AspM_Slickus01]|nr:hypothetical protein [Alishewanella phage vB_AspM_Slickus01]
MLYIKRVRLGKLKLTVIGFQYEYVCSITLSNKPLRSFSVKRINVKHVKNDIKDKLQFFFDKISRRKVYFYNSGMDCDGVSYGSPMTFENIDEANDYIDNAYEWADGYMNFTRISKKQAKEAESYSRDTYAERMNY